ncbi:hypothetical protein B0G84_2315 [Paraburkholderia sp. BL8N3]|nr:lysozyme [Paraburkholderia sp. BL8N3]TCK43967.1 hypothetical protein B0G84_2315 [Paraburkholderia sp. BL8N3]
MNGYSITGIAAGVLGAALGFGTAHVIDGRTLAREQAAHAAVIAKINADSAKAFADALANQQAAEGKVAAIEKSFSDEVSKHAQDSLDHRARLAAGTDRVRVRIASCALSAASESAATADSADGAATYGYLDGQVASSVFKVAADDQVEIDKLTALQAYVRGLQDHGYIAH